MESLDILLVEDDAGSRYVYSRLLERFGFGVDVAEHGQMAIEKLTSSSRHFDVIVSDINMPVMDGLELARCVRHDPRFADLRLVAVTAFTHSLMLDAIRDAGFEALCAKPLEIQQLVAVIRECTTPQLFHRTTCDCI